MIPGCSLPNRLHKSGPRSDSYTIHLQTYSMEEGRSSRRAGRPPRVHGVGVGRVRWLPVPREAHAWGGHHQLAEVGGRLWMRRR